MTTKYDGIYGDLGGKPKLQFKAAKHVLCAITTTKV